MIMGTKRDNTPTTKRSTRHIVQTAASDELNLNLSFKKLVMGRPTNDTTMAMTTKAITDWIS